MHIFFDTEFTGLIANARLISIGLVDESGSNEFYAELRDTYRIEDCSNFCIEHVLPHLQGHEARISLAELRSTLYAWLIERGPGAILVCDSARDVVQLATILPDGLPANVAVKVLGWWDNLRRRVFNAGRRIHRQRGLRVHHALDDARVNRLVLAGR
jgi:hypothetical protein